MIYSSHPFGNCQDLCSNIEVDKSILNNIEHAFQAIFTMVDEIMLHCAPYVRLFTFDGEACNQLLRAFLHGTASPANRKKALESDLKVFSRMEYHAIPGTQNLPRCPLRIAILEGEPIYAMPGPAHAAKNAAGQVCAAGKVLHFGTFAADAAGALSHGLPVPAFARKDAMSDRLCSLLCNPLFLVSDDVPCMNHKNPRVIKTI